MKDKTMKVQKEFYNKLSTDKIQINWNKKPIEMELFLSFLKIPVERSNSHLGSNTGWTQLFNEEHKLTIKGGIIKRIEYLDSLQYGIKLSNPYNNYVNPFYLFALLTDKGKLFFLDYYTDDIVTIVKNQSDKIDYLSKQTAIAKQVKADIIKEVESLHKN